MPRRVGEHVVKFVRDYAPQCPPECLASSKIAGSRPEGDQTLPNLVAPDFAVRHHLSVGDVCKTERLGSAECAEIPGDLGLVWSPAGPSEFQDHQFGEWLVSVVFARRAPVQRDA